MTWLNKNKENDWNLGEKDKRDASLKMIVMWGLTTIRNPKPMKARIIHVTMKRGQCGPRVNIGSPVFGLK
jgi:hypothetical protein